MTTRKPLIPWNKRLGRVGEYAIKMRLAYFSNPTNFEEDVGIDFYCELLENDTPSTPFCVQAKSKEYLDKSWRGGILKKTIRYWLEQLHPVFLIIYDDETKDCFWLSIEDIRYDLIHKLQNSSSKTISIKVDNSNILENDRNKNQPFIDKIKHSSSSIQLFLGQPQFIGNGYVKNIPYPPRSDIELRKIRANVRSSLYSLIQHYMTTDSTGLEKARVYCEFLTEFDKSHYNHFFWLGQIYRILGESEKAIQNFKESLKICQRDKNWPTEHMNIIIEIIKNEIEQCKSNDSKNLDL